MRRNELEGIVIQKFEATSKEKRSELFKTVLQIIPTRDLEWLSVSIVPMQAPEPEVRP